MTKIAILIESSLGGNELIEGYLLGLKAANAAEAYTQSKVEDINSKDLKKIFGKNPDYLALKAKKTPHNIYLFEAELNNGTPTVTPNNCCSVIY